MISGNGTEKLFTTRFEILGLEKCMCVILINLRNTIYLSEVYRIAMAVDLAQLKSLAMELLRLLFC